MIIRFGMVMIGLSGIATNALAQERLYRIETGEKKIGFISATGRIVLRGAFDYLSTESYHGYRWIHQGGRREGGYIKGGRWGLIRLGTPNDGIVLEPQFDWMGRFHEGLAPVLLSGHWGFVDTTGRVRIRPSFPDLETPESDVERIRRDMDNEAPPENWFPDGSDPVVDKITSMDDGSRPSWCFVFRNGLSRMKTLKGDVLIDTTGRVVRTIDRSVPVQGQVVGELAIVQSGASYGVVDRLGRTVVPFREKKITGARQVTDFLCWIKAEWLSGGSTWRMANVLGETMAEPEFDDVWVRPHFLSWVRQNGQWGLMDTSGAFLLKPQFDKIEHYYEYGMKVQKNKKWGLVNEHGRLIHVCAWDALGYPDEGMAKFEVDQRIGFLNRDGDILIAPSFRRVEYPSHGFVWASTDSGWCALNRKGVVVVPANPKFQFVYGFDDEGVAWFRCDDRYGLVDTTGRIVREPVLEFRNPCAFREGLGWVQNNGVWTLLKTDGDAVFQIRAESVENFDGDLAVITWSKDRWGYIDNSGKVVWKN